VTVVVNVASEWGLTERDYTQLQGNGLIQRKKLTNIFFLTTLQALYEKYQADGFRVVAFPSNQFGNQEPGSNAEIKHFAQSKFGVTFDMMAKTDVNGDNTEPVYQWMKNHKNGSGFLFDTIKWNFTKFLIGRDGQVVSRYGPRTEPNSFEDDIVEQLF